MGITPGAKPRHRLIYYISSLAKTLLHLTPHTASTKLKTKPSKYMTMTYVINLKKINKQLKPFCVNLKI